MFKRWITIVRVICNPITNRDKEIY
jgi:hypothetical protein